MLGLAGYEASLDYAKTRTQGLGLGLAICDTLARALDGELRMANHPEGGAQLSLYLRSADPGVTFPSED